MEGQKIIKSSHYVPVCFDFDDYVTQLEHENIHIWNAPTVSVADFYGLLFAEFALSVCTFSLHQFHCILTSYNLIHNFVALLCIWWIHAHTLETFVV